VVDRDDRDRRHPAGHVPVCGSPVLEKWQTAIDRQYPGWWWWRNHGAVAGVLSYFEGGTRRGGVDTKLSSMLDFRATCDAGRVCAGQPMTKLVDVLAQDSLYLHPERLVAFVGITMGREC